MLQVATQQNVSLKENPALFDITAPDIPHKMTKLTKPPRNDSEVKLKVTTLGHTRKYKL